ncbi:serine/threonine-protein kinase PLK2-like [Bufo gargarizans]|uniref:serine/threonine-protein kinase PLK2-like n=1 Tax=Bufo gargarizans TaxID=30331 RepID=UPI001CF278C1|nr:serine/threonine-protein kinase PLK2-like [Bufo gargarizans]
MEVSGNVQPERLHYVIEDPESGSLYKRGKLLGKGAFGRCYKCTDVSSRQVFAVKMISHTRNIVRPQRGGVKKEIELHSQLKHRNIVRFYHHFQDQKYMYLVMEYCRHKSLAHILRVRKLLTEPEVRYYMKQILQGVQFLHQQGIIHRDLKLSNFFIAKNMVVKIGDLGLATTVEQCEKIPGIICGTPNYLSPEVLAKDGHSFKSDIWALGCIMYTMLSGYSPFRAHSQKEMYYFIREGFFPVPSYISLSVKRLIISLLASCPSSRPCIEDIISHEFFTQGFTPEKLSSSTCHTAPTFSFSLHLPRFFRKAAKVLYRGVFHKYFCSDFAETEGHKSSMVMPTESLMSLSTVKMCEDEKSEETVRTCDESLNILMKGRMNHRNKMTSQREISGDRVVEDLMLLLEDYLQNIVPGELDSKVQVTYPILWVTKWVDYSNKYGFGYQLSDNCIGVLLSDGTHTILSPHLRKVCYSTSLQEHITFPERSPPCKLDIKMRILRFFSQYMKENILEGGDLRAAPSRSVRTLCLLHFLKTDQALLMLFSNGTLQVNFYHDRTKIILSKGQQGYLLSFVDQERQSCTVLLSVLQSSCPPFIIHRLEYALMMLQSL